MKKIPKTGWNMYDLKKILKYPIFIVLLFNFVNNISMCTLETL